MTIYWTSGSALAHGSKFYIKHSGQGATIKLENETQIPTEIFLYLPVQGIADGLTANQVTVDVVATTNSVMKHVEVFNGGKSVSLNNTNVTTASKPSFPFTSTNAGGFVVAITVLFNNNSSEFKLNGAGITVGK
jgi:hypothetical protein